MSGNQLVEEKLIQLTIDDKIVKVPKGTTVYNAAKQLGIDIPIFCYLDRMPPFGACRMCLVEVEKMAKPQTACTLEVTEGMVVKTQTPSAVNARKDIIEFLLLNHPLDCPICDRGGECPLQDNALEHGPGRSRFFEDKRRFRKPLPLGPVLMLDRERCIVCARCTRFGDLLAGDHALEFIERGFKTEVGTPNEGPAESKFIGNTIMICPVGALTSQVYRFRARPWDNDPTDSTCTLCPVGCSMILDSRDGEIMRTRSRENRDVNDIWLCDKGWFGYEFTHSPERLTTPLIRRNGELISAHWDEAYTLIAEKIKEAKPDGRLAAFGGNPLTFEENYLFQKLMRQGAGVNHLDHRIGMPITNLSEEGIAPGMEMSIGECENLSFAILFGLDLTEEFPVIWLRLRQAINKGAKVYFLGHFAPEIAPYLSKVYLHAPGKELEVIHNLSNIVSFPEGKSKGALFIGSQYLNSPNRQTILTKLLQLQQSKENLSLNIMEGRGNSVGARLAGMHPNLGPFEEILVTPGLNAIEVMKKTASEGWDFLYVAGCNPAMLFPSSLWKQAREKLKFLVVQDLFLTETANQADVVLPTLSFVEKGGSFVNIEGRIQTIMPGKAIPENIFSDEEIFMEIADRLNMDLTLDANFAEKSSKVRIHFKRPSTISPSKTSEPELNKDQLRLSFSRVLFDHGVRMEHDSHLFYLSKEPFLRVHPNEGKKREIKDDDTVHVATNEGSLIAKVKLDPTVAEGTLVVPLGFEKHLPVRDLGANLMNGTAVKITRSE